MSYEKHCRVCGTAWRRPGVTAWDAFNVDRSRADGLANICKECNAQKSKDWYAKHRTHKIAATRRYKAQRSGQPAPVEGEIVPKTAYRPRKTISPIQPAAPVERAEFHGMRFSDEEWAHINRSAWHMGVKPEEYVRALVRYDMRRQAAVEEARRKGKQDAA